MSINIDLEKVNFDKFVITLMEKNPKINDRGLLEKIILEFGNRCGEDLIVMHNEYYEDGICTWNMTRMIREVFDLNTDPYEIFLDLRKEIVSYKEIDEAYDNLDLERKRRYDEEEE